MIALAALLVLPLGALAAPADRASAAAAPAAEATTPLTGTDGLIHVSALSAVSAPSILPSGGGVTITVSVQNLTKHPVPGTIDFWITTPWGARVSALAPAKVKALAPGEKRTLTASLDGPGQWTLVTAHAKFTPPSTVDKLPASAQERSELLLVPPLFALAALVVLTLAALVLTAAVRRRRDAAGHGTAEHDAAGEAIAPPGAIAPLEKGLTA